MEPKERLGALVVARRVQLGYKTRGPFAEAANLSLRTLGDIETGRRPSYDAATIAAVENALGWTVGSVARILSGGEPTLTEVGTDPSAPDGGLTEQPDDSALHKVMQSALSDEQKRRLIRMLLDEREVFFRQRAERADAMIQMFREGE